MIIIRSSFIFAFTEIIKVKLVHPRFPPPPLLPRHNHQCPEDQPVSLVTQDVPASLRACVPARHAGTQARRHAGSQARRHAGSQARRHAGSQARRLAGTQARRLAGSQARRLAGTQARRLTETDNANYTLCVFHCPHCF